MMFIRPRHTLPTLLLSFSAWCVSAADAPADRPDRRREAASGEITDLQPHRGRFALQTADGKKWQMVVDDRSRLRMDGQPAKLGDFKNGQRVRVRFEPGEGQNRVLMMRTAVTAEAVGRRVQEALQAVKNYSYEQRGDYERRLQDVLSDLQDRIDDLKA
jgi:hypothetical protein